MKYRSYPEYRDSDVEWLGEIPAEWHVRRLKRHLRLNDSGVWGEDPNGDDGTVVLRSTDQTLDGKWSVEAPARRRLDSSERRDARLATGDLVITKSSGSALHIGKTTVVTPEIEALDCCFSNFMQRLRCRPNLHPKLLFHVLNSRMGREQLDYFSSTTTGLANLNGDVIGNTLLAVPPPAEQSPIVVFLDRETAKIDSLVAKKERLVELLREKRTALITRVVTKGLDPNAAMKESGVEWIGRIPLHWNILRTKFVARLESGHTPSRQHPEYWTDCTVPWFTLADVWQIREDHLESVTSTSEKVSEIGLANSSARLLPAGTVMLSRTASVGFSAIMGTAMATTQDFVNWVCAERIRPEFLLYVFRAMRPEFERLVMGSTHQTIYMPDVGRFVCPVPPRPEQDAIVESIRRETARIDALIAKVREAIERLKEYRTALISAAVTGKIDVREEGPGDPC